MSARSRIQVLRLITILFGIAVGIGIAEAALRVNGFSFHTFPKVQFGWPVPEEIVEEYVPDRDVFWVPHEYAQRLAEARSRPPRTVFLGDSCTEFGAYADLALAKLKTLAPELADGLKLGVGGWSSAQGLTQLKRDVLPLRPKVVSIYFGWNDHWVALGADDAHAQPGMIEWQLSQHLRLYQFWLKARLTRAIGSLADRPLRVPREQYEANLREMVTSLHAQGAEAVLITAPSAHVRGHEPAYLADRHVARLDDLVPLHISYVETTRAVAATTKAVLCDADRVFREAPGPAQQYFMEDGIHLSPAGDALMAETVAACIASTSARKP